MQCKKTAQSFARRKATERNIVISQLSEQVNDYESRLPLPELEDALMEQTKGELESQIMEKTQGIIFRSKAKWHELGEKNTKYFFSLEKAKYNAKTCYKMLDDNNVEISNPQEILELQRHFYEKLYEEDRHVQFSMLNNSGILVPENLQQQQKQQISMEELESAVKSMKNEKTPGQDGLPVDFYKVFWRLLKEPFYDMMIECYEQKYMHASARKGILNLIPKANKDVRLVKNLRPITLLNTDYKIIEKAVANKILPTLHLIINKDQRGFMKGRRISVNIRKFLDIMHCVELQNLEAVVLSLDFVKCFDKCSFDILHGSLKYFGFGEMVQEWTKILYTDFTVEIQNNGYFSQRIPILKGVHQGGCCSSLYFLIIAEILAIALRDNTEIVGITIQDVINLLNQFADDMDIFSSCSEQSIRAIFKELDSFHKQSGFTVSYDKTTLYRIGSLRFSNAQMYGIDQVVWSKEDITVLGVTIAHENVVEKNYTPLIEKSRKTLLSWENRGLSLLGKIQVVNTLVASLFVYKLMVLPLMPKHIVKQVDNIIKEFNWNKKKAKIAYNILQNPKHQGGLGLVKLQDRDIALKASWPTILVKEEEYA